MAHLSPEFKHDVFFSYAHGVVDGDATSNLRDWSRKLAEDVRKQLRTWKQFNDLTFYIDDSERDGERLAPTDGVHDGLRDAASASAIFLCALSDWYVDSEWCGKERGWWHEHARAAIGREALAEIERRFVLIAQELTDGREWPPELQDQSGGPLRGYRAYRSHDAVLKRVLLGISERDRAARQDLIIDLSGDLGETLKNIREALKTERAKRLSEAKLKGCAEFPASLFIHAPEDCSEAFDRAQRQLADEGYIVFPESHRPLPRNGRLTDAEMTELSASDGLMLVAGGTRRPLLADFVIVGRNIRRLLQAELLKLIPAGVLDPLGRDQHPRESVIGAQSLGLQWFEITDEAWPGRVKAWLAEMAERDTARPGA